MLRNSRRVMIAVKTLKSGRVVVTSGVTEITEVKVIQVGEATRGEGAMYTRYMAVIWYIKNDTMA